MSMNRVTLLGNLGSDPEQKETKDGTEVCVLNLATNRRVKSSDGNSHSHTNWHNIVCFGTTAVNCGKYLKKGKEILVEGRIETQKWKTKEGENRLSFRIVASSVHFLGGKTSEVDESSLGDFPLEDPLDSII